MFRWYNLKKSALFLTHIRTNNILSCHAKAWKFKHPQSQNKEPFQTKQLYK